MWKWYDDTNWVDYGKAQNDILDKAGNNFRIDVDDERYVETSDLKEIYRLFGELPKDITGLCALQHRKDNPQRVRLVKNAAIDTLIHDTIFFYGEREYSKSRCRLEAESLGATITNDYLIADEIVMNYSEQFNKEIKEIVQHCKKNGTKIYETQWISDCFDGKVKVNTHEITQKWITHVDEMVAEFEKDENGFKNKYHYTPNDTKITIIQSSEDDGEEYDDEYNSENTEDGTYSNEQNEEDSQSQKEEIFDLKGSVFEGKITYSESNEEYTFQMWIEDDKNVKGIITWFSLHNCQTRFEGTRKENTFHIIEKSFLRGEAFSELGEYDIIAKSTNILEGSLVDDVKTHIQLLRVTPKKRKGEMNSNDFFENCSKAQCSLELQMKGEVNKEEDQYQIIITRGESTIKIPIERIENKVIMKLEEIEKLFNEIPNELEMYETDQGIEAVPIEEEDFIAKIHFDEMN
ncbi:hypothetical protein EDI_022850 [Entamoeba dispar SAW760]|uniref:BRCT domain-containing protein n=1 Tax=Entamoeba dispar (strain ATCC PRA-260 / SAW760) TaxID=370354 RepID=B0EML8_ENTDS|nr:uncharacterized protein EDI_022850 [Entamoeba dispar SAW760]EDR24227.1 hypothetical protein EDI_022850 [Entamoeba dispar SAW760]|eukprot:EDR24227.1 hypothetical protein EDI_022850 [Entamoeba dispar SAW760]